MADKIKIKVILGSTREGRFGDKPARWIYDEAKKLEGAEAELLDLRDYPMPFFNEPLSPSMRQGDYSYPNETLKKWAEKIAEADAFIIASPEYNHGYPAVLKNALDWTYKEWHKKAVGFVSWGSVGGSRAVEQLRQVAVELQMAPIRQAIHIPSPVYTAVKNEKVPVKPELFEPLKDAKEKFLEQLLWWAKALEAAREKDSK